MNPTELTTHRFQPTFSIETSLQSNQFVARLKHAVDEQSTEFMGRFTNDHALVAIVESDRHFWSPWLHLDVRRHESGNSVFGRFSPHPNIWTAFKFSYLGLLIATFFSFIGGWSQILAGESCWGFYLIPFWVVVGVLLWVASQVGQRLAIEEMERLKTLVQLCLESEKT
ncbi:MAG: hypothetical protein AAFN77_11890 [Planctomycetota bacterium]